MGMFDYVDCDDVRVVCSNGHRLESLQTKDLDCVLGTIVIFDGRVLQVCNGPLQCAPAVMPLTDTMDIYEDCTECLVLLTHHMNPRTGREHSTIHTLWCEFTLTIVDNVVVDVKRISEPFETWLASVPFKSWLLGCEGPMTHAEAVARRRPL